MLAETVDGRSIVTVKSTLRSFLVPPVLGLEGVVHPLAVITHWSNDRMLVQELEQFLFRCLARDECSDCPEAIGAVTDGDLAGILDRRGRMAFGEAQETQEYAHPLDAADLDHRLGPGGAVGAQPAPHLAQEPRSATLDPADLLRSDELGWGAEAAWLFPGMNDDRLHPLVEDPHQAGVPPHPDLPSQVLRRHRVVGPLDLDVAVTVHRATRFLIRRERGQRQRHQRGPLHLGEVLADLAGVVP